jgi:hypothetical protein
MYPVKHFAYELGTPYLAVVSADHLPPIAINPLACSFYLRASPFLLAGTGWPIYDDGAHRWTAASAAAGNAAFAYAGSEAAAGAGAGTMAA